jgi:hypothetical protein
MISKEALRCLANALLLSEQSRQILVDLDFAREAADKLKIDDRDYEFLISRILFLLTYNTSLDFGKLIEEQDLSSRINRNIAGHAESIPALGRKAALAPAIHEMAMHETLKLLFNITYHYPRLAPEFAPSIDHLLHILFEGELQDPPLQPPITLLINALLNLDLGAKFVDSNIEISKDTSMRYHLAEQTVDRLVSILDSAVRKQAQRELDEAAAPLCTLLRQLYGLNIAEVQDKMKSLLLPADSERGVPLGKGDTLPSRLLRMSCSPELPTLRDNISSLLFELSDKDASAFINNIGYGYASGYLMNNKIPIPANATPATNTAGKAGTSADVAFNPITGQSLSTEETASTPMPEMTEEEKEREAERLFVLFERLKGTGVMDVTNPVEQAVREGRFEELD